MNAGGANVVPKIVRGDIPRPNKTPHVSVSGQPGPSQWGGQWKSITGLGREIRKGVRRFEKIKIALKANRVTNVSAVNSKNGRTKENILSRVKESAQWQKTGEKSGEEERVESRACSEKKGTSGQKDIPEPSLSCKTENGKKKIKTCVGRTPWTPKKYRGLETKGN